jgi:hypothetical protein
MSENAARVALEGIAGKSRKGNRGLMGDCYSTPKAFLVAGKAWWSADNIRLFGVCHRGLV